MAEEARLRASDILAEAHATLGEPAQPPVPRYRTCTTTNTDDGRAPVRRGRAVRFERAVVVGQIASQVLTHPVSPEGPGRSQLFTQLLGCFHVGGVVRDCPRAQAQSCSATRRSVHPDPHAFQRSPDEPADRGWVDGEVAGIEARA